MQCQTDTPAFQIINVSEPDYDEVVTLDEIKKFSHIDQDYASNDVNLDIMRESAIQKLEGLTNLYFAKREAKIQFYGDVCELPYGPQPVEDAITEVTKNNDPELITDYTVNGLNYKTISIGSGSCGCNVTSWFYPIWGGYPLPWTWTPGQENFYNVSYNTGFGTGGNPLPKALKHAVLMLIDYFVKEQGTTDLDVPVAIQKLANRFSKNLVIQ